MTARFIALASLVWFAMVPAQAQDDALSNEAAAMFAESLVGELRAVAGEADTADSERVGRLRAVLREDLATEQIGRFVLGSTGRDGAAPEALEQYEALFPDFIATAFAAEIGELATREIRIDDVVRRRPDEVIVRSTLIGSSGREAADIDWRVRLIDGEPRLLDVLVERVSPILTKREEINALLSRGGMESVIGHMQTVIATQGDPGAMPDPQPER